jgi:uncharacterized protein (TIGR02466 family)
MYKFTIDSPSGKSLGNLQLWFLKTIFQADDVLEPAYLARLHSVTENMIAQKGIQTTAMQTWISTHQTDNLILYPEYKILIDEILERIRAFGETLGFCSKTQMEHLRIANMWANKSSAGDFTFPHVHPNSVFSGVFYLEAPAGSTIIFYDNPCDMGIDPKEFNTFSRRHANYMCTTNSLLLFKSDMMHGNEKQPPGNKLAISFNAVF